MDEYFGKKFSRKHVWQIRQITCTRISTKYKLNLQSISSFLYIKKYRTFLPFVRIEKYQTKLSFVSKTH